MSKRAAKLHGYQVLPITKQGEKKRERRKEMTYLKLPVVVLSIRSVRVMPNFPVNQSFKASIWNTLSLARTFSTVVEYFVSSVSKFAVREVKELNAEVIADGRESIFVAVIVRSGIGIDVDSFRSSMSSSFRS